jgi:hypothetical protein
MDAIELIHTRYPFSALGAPAPLAKVVRSFLESATHIPDHGRLLPWSVWSGGIDPRLPGAVMACALLLPA